MAQQNSTVSVGSLGSLQYTHNGTDIATAITDSFNVTVSDGGGGQTTGAIGILVTHSRLAAAYADRILRLTPLGLIEEPGGA